MDIVTIIICMLVFLTLNYLFMIWAVSVALKAYTKTLAQIIDTCASEDKDSLFMKHWRSSHR